MSTIAFILLAASAGTPPIFVEAGGEGPANLVWKTPEREVAAVELDGPWCDQYASREVGVVGAQELSWERVRPLVAALERCKVERVGLGRTTRAITWFRLGSPSPIVLVVDSSAVHLIADGETTRYDPYSARHRRALTELLGTAARPTLALRSDLPMSEVLEVASHLPVIAGEAAILTLDENPPLGGPSRVTWTALRDPRGLADDLPAPTGTGKLTRMFGQSEIPTKVPTEMPAWAAQGSRVCKTTDRRVIWGAGSVSGIKNHALARVTADNRARAEIAKAMSVSVTTQTGPGGERSTKTFASATLTGVQILDHWFSPDGAVFALAEMEAPANLALATADACPKGTVTTWQWGWTHLDDAGRGDTTPEDWRVGDLGRNDEVWWFVARVSTTASYTTASALKTRAARAQLVSVLLEKAAMVAGALADERAVHCLLETAWERIAEGATAASGWNGEERELWVRLTISREGIRPLLPSGCTMAVIEDIFPPGSPAPL